MGERQRRRLDAVLADIQSLIEQSEEADPSTLRALLGGFASRLRRFRADPLLHPASVDGSPAVLIDAPLMLVVHEAIQGQDVRLASREVDDGWIACDRGALIEGFRAIFALCAESRGRTTPLSLSLERTEGPVWLRAAWQGKQAVRLTVTTAHSVLAAPMSVASLGDDPLSGWRRVSATIFAHSGEVEIVPIGFTGTIVNIYLPLSAHSGLTSPTP